VSCNGGTCTLTFTFKPTKVGAESATWTLTDNGGGTQKLTLRGTGTAAKKLFVSQPNERNRRRAL
jgi:hypothetical protein